MYSSLPPIACSLPLNPRSFPLSQTYAAYRRGRYPRNDKIASRGQPDLCLELGALPLRFCALSGLPKNTISGSHNFFFPSLMNSVCRIIASHELSLHFLPICQGKTHFLENEEIDFFAENLSESEL